MRLLFIVLLSACWSGSQPAAPSNVATKQPLVVGEDSIPSTGSPAAKVKIVSYYNYRCPHCITFEPIFEAIVKKYGDRIFVQYRTLRLPAWADSDDAAAAALAAHRQGQFFAMHRELFEGAQVEGSKFDAETLRSYATAIGLDVARFERDMADPKLRARVADDTVQAEAAEVSFVPFLSINGTPYEGDRALGPLSAKIDQLLR